MITINSDDLRDVEESGNKMPIEDSLLKRMKRLTQKDSDDLERGILKAELVEKVQNLSTEQGRKFIVDYGEYFSHDFIDVLLAATDRKEEGIE
jgi:hypothetical protein